MAGAGDVIMKCELCKREGEIPDAGVLCETCADMIHRLVTINRRSDQIEVPLAKSARVG